MNARLTPSAGYWIYIYISTRPASLRERDPGLVRRIHNADGGIIRTGCSSGIGYVFASVLGKDIGRAVLTGHLHASQLRSCKGCNVYDVADGPKLQSMSKATTAALASGGPFG